MKKSTFEKVALGSVCALLAITMTGCASANQDAAIKNLSGQLDRVTNTVGQMSTADIQSLNPTDYYANPARYYNAGKKGNLASNVSNRTNYNQFYDSRNNPNPSTAGYRKECCPEEINNSSNYATMPTGYRTTKYGPSDKNYYRYQYQNPSLQQTTQNQYGNLENQNGTKLQSINQRLSTSMGKTMNCVYEQDYMKESLLNQCTMIKNDINQKLKLSSNQVKALNGLTNSISRYATNLNNNKTDVTNSLKMIRKNSSKSNYNDLEQTNAYYQSLNNHLDARLCYFQNLMNTMAEVQNILDDAQSGNVSPNSNYAPANQVKTADKTTPSRDIYHGHHHHFYEPQQQPATPEQRNDMDQNLNNNTQTENTGIKNIDTMTSSNNANDVKNNTTPNNLNGNNGQYPLNNENYNNAMYGSNGPNGGYYNSNGVNGNRYNNAFNPNRNTDTYGPGITNIDTYKTYPNGNYSNGYNNVGYNENLQLQQDVNRNEVNFHQTAKPKKSVTNEQLKTPAGKQQTLPHLTEEKELEQPKTVIKQRVETQNLSSQTIQNKNITNQATANENVVSKNQNDIRGKIINAPVSKQPQVSDIQTRTQEVKKVHPAGIRPNAANDTLNIVGDTNKTIEKLIKG